jgi:hypothetical protein
MFSLEIFPQIAYISEMFAPEWMMALGLGAKGAPNPVPTDVAVFWKILQLGI